MVAPYICGYVTGTAPHMPGATERYTFEVDDEICADSSVISMATMVGKLTNLL